MSSVFEVAKNISIAEVYSRYFGGSLMPSRTRGNVSCPFHSDKSPSMHLYQDTNTFYCFSCKRHGSPIDLYMEYTGISEAFDAAKSLCDDFGLTYDLPKIDLNYKQYLDVICFVAKIFRRLLQTSCCPNSNYFTERGFSKELQEKYLLGFCPDIIVGRDNSIVSLKDMILDKFPNLNPDILDSYKLYDKYGNSYLAGRYIFTIFNSEGNPIGFSGRTIHSYNSKYFNSIEIEYFHKRELLFNYHEAKKYPIIFVCEGYCDALSLVSLGFPNVVACMGTSLTPEHLKLLSGKQIILCLDNDGAGQEQTLSIIKKYREKIFHILSWTNSTYKDFNEMLIGNKDTLLALISEAKTITPPEFLIRYYKANYNLGELVYREALWVDLASLIGSNNDLYLTKYPINTNYTPVAYDYYWLIFDRIFKNSWRKK